MSRYLSYLLRHGAVKEGLNIDNEGFVFVSELLVFLVRNNSDIKDIAMDATKLHLEADIDTLEKLQKIAQEDAKQRFLLLQRDDTWVIRANQGHSISTVTEEALILITDPDMYPEVIHGTFRKNLESIKLTGLSRVKRNQIHLSSSMDASSGIRKTGNVFIYIDLPLAMREGIKFYISDNGVILTPGNDNGILEPKYFKQIVDTKGNDLLTQKSRARNREPTIPCAGCLVFRLRDGVQEVCVISTHSGKQSSSLGPFTGPSGVYGFPKGKRNKEKQR